VPARTASTEEHGKLQIAVFTIEVVAKIERRFLSQGGANIRGDDDGEIVGRSSAEGSRPRHDVTEHHALSDEDDDDAEHEAESDPPVEAAEPACPAW
jgi:hypothetical protein